MNYLAHLYFGDSLEMRIGNLAQDFLDPGVRDISKYPPEMQRGLIVHKKIDRFNDDHRLFHESMPLIRSVHQARCKHIAIDVFNDHFLAVNWSTYSSLPLRLFAKEIYWGLTELQDHLPPRLVHTIPYMTRDNWLVSYSTREGMRAALGRLEQILSKGNSRSVLLLPAMENFEEHYEVLNDNFNRFFPRLILETKKWFKESRSPG